MTPWLFMFFLYSVVYERELIDIEFISDPLQD